MAPILLTLLAVTTILMVRRTALGLFIEAVGINPSAARFAGLRSKLVVMIVYSFSGFCAGIAGLLTAADIRGADANNAGLWLELDAILAVVIGGTSLLGGRFSILLSIMGAMIIQATHTGILVSGLPPEFNLIVKAAVILVILVLQSPKAAGVLRRKRGRRA
jgi:galactofuranose transport system permease protein